VFNCVSKLWGDVEGFEHFPEVGVRDFIVCFLLIQGYYLS
jgi:hypothetical protein